ncbi:Cyst wall protein, type 4 [Carpediemonas membranifera]|uniref:Cyst wall protein, type 4 n=1 Tax=Carpediemonas membranifera TaxID=201153 RepID=A0A8J6AQG6_9EUKA|nr:Cyst wall protein, type 4 [Carpediemonas membranifera]|eukprot:KAG9391003.1 Cyst wall protein, type 4 [Carpediemonas membranifera]
MNKIIASLLLLSLVAYSLCCDSEAGALMTLYNELNGDDWIDNTNWNQGEPCTNAWYGITCENNQVTSVDLRNNGLFGILPADGSIACLSFLKSLLLTGNEIFGDIPVEIFDMSLQHLLLDDNYLTGILPDVSGLRNIKSIVLGNNKLTGNLTESVCAAANLRWLNLAGNMFGGDLPECVNELPELQQIVINCNSFISVPDFTNSTLTVLDIRENEGLGCPAWAGAANTTVVCGMSMECPDKCPEVHTDYRCHNDGVVQSYSFE